MSKLVQEILVKWFEGAGLSQADAAQLFGVHEATFFRWITGISKMSKLKDLAKLEKLIENRERLIQKGEGK